MCVCVCVCVCVRERGRERDREVRKTWDMSMAYIERVVFGRMKRERERETAGY